MKTYIVKSEDFVRQWFIVDATGQILGRMATELAIRLRGKHKSVFAPYLDTGDFFVVINANKIVLTGNKWDKKTYYRHSGYPGGITSIVAKKLRDKKPEDLIRMAVHGMLPKNRLGRQLLRKLKIYAGEEHPHVAQQPKSLVLYKRAI